MKPSERLTELQNELLARWRIVLGPEEFERERQKVENGTAIAAIEQYLDEQHELAEKRERRMWVAAALAGISASVGTKSANECLRLAGLSISVWDGDLLDRARARVMEAAREAGLL